MLKRVVITGIGGITALGRDWATIRSFFDRGENAVVRMDDWDRFPELNTRLAAPIFDYKAPNHWTRKQLRSLGPVSQYCVEAAEMALADAGLSDDPSIKDGRMGVASGSSTGSTKDVCDLAQLISLGKSDGFNANTYVRMMPHTTAANVAIFFSLKGRVIPTSSACTSGSQAIGYAYEAIKFGRIPMMLAGGGEELCPSESHVFDALYATSLKNDTPKLTPSPYDSNRDGLVIGEGAGMLLLEEYEHAKARGAKIYAEIVGFGTNCDGTHITRPESETMYQAMKLALDDAAIPPSLIGYVNGHGTATEQGDIAETIATNRLFGNRVAISSQKSYLGHTLGACGALESWFSIAMMNDNSFVQTANLVNIDPRCGELDYIQNTSRHIETEYVMNNNFAFGGVNTSLIFKRL
ncbi:3-oxoacyl-[acyl-carrier-protein] synthase II [Cricetibacter osteomyelitidis]|uniref:3-oxoacyl-[acyl-carrier-protein] synthase II n=1 Tax=Cricetibacter osteomyelitidis TaxID=1521931 RepID=A0A4R2TCS7_9PAST|nr:beta-ketoacyl-ACP synthase [Cricetibacter osteomyelitidis]TCP94908.1 3-oxoacyl-[acyl-carrier-protein] synthase II [Cricetibacter osteomyelitidis]